MEVRVEHGWNGVLYPSCDPLGALTEIRCRYDAIQSSNWLTSLYE